MASKTPIIFVIFQTGNQANGGVESITQVIEKSQELEKIVITQIETPVNKRWQQAGAEVKIWSIPYEIKSSFWQGNLQEQLARLTSRLSTNYQMYQLLKQTKINLVHCNDLRALRHTGWGAKLGGAKVIFNIRDVQAPGVKYRQKWRNACQLSDYQLVLSQEMATALGERIPIKNDRRDRLKVIYSMVDRAQMFPVSDSEKQLLRQSLGISPTTFAIGYVATCSEKKAQLPFLEQAASWLQSHLPQGHVYFLGDFDPERNPYAHQCQIKVAQLGLESSLTFVGYTEAIASWYQALDLVIIPTRNEGLARSMIESLACGTPVVSFAVCSAREILEQYNCGLVVESGDYLTLGEKIVDLAQNPDLREQMRTNALNTTQNLFNPEKITQAYENFYKNIL